MWHLSSQQKTERTAWLSTICLLTKKSQLLPWKKYTFSSWHIYSINCPSMQTWSFSLNTSRYRLEIQKPWVAFCLNPLQLTAPPTALPALPSSLSPILFLLCSAEARRCLTPPCPSQAANASAEAPNHPALPRAGSCLCSSLARGKCMNFSDYLVGIFQEFRFQPQQ